MDVSIDNFSCRSEIFNTAMSLQVKKEIDKYPVRKRCTRHRAFYLMLSLACGRIALFVWTPFVQERDHASATNVSFLCVLC